MDERNAVVKPALNFWTLTFRDAGLENEYRQETARQSLPMLRFGLLLALVLYVLFGVLDYWLLPGNFHLVVAIRASVGLMLGAVCACSYFSWFDRWRTVLVAGVSLSVAISIVFLLHLLPREIGDYYYPGLFLLIYGTYALVGLRFTQSTAVSVASVAMYLGYELIVAGRQDGMLVVNIVFLTGAAIIACMGGYTTEYLRRLSFFQRKLIERDRARSQYLALHDTLTGLANRRLMTQHLQQTLARNTRYGTLSALLFIDLDGFKEVNDTLGHEFGDKLLVAVANGLKRVTREVDLVARLGGDEFVVVLEDLGAAEEAELLVKRMQKAFAEPVEIDGRPTPIRMSIGLALHPADGDTPEALMSAADKAMYRIKRARRRTSVA